MNTKQLNPIWKKIYICTLSLIALSVVGIVAACLIYELKISPRSYKFRKTERVVYTNDHIWIQRVSKGGCLLYSQAYDIRTEKPVSDKFRWFASHVDEYDTLSVYCDMNGKRGYINLNTGKFNISGQYDHAWNFSEGLGAVVVNNKVGFINPQGEFVIPCQIPVSTKAIQNIGFAFHDGLCVMTNENDLCGLINQSGEWVLHPQYDCIWNPNKAHQRIYQNDGKYGLMDKSGKVILPATYDYIYDKKGHYQLVKDGVMCTMDYKLNIINPFVVTKTETEYFALDEDEEIATEFIKYHIYDKEGIMDHNGKVIIPAKYIRVDIVGTNLFRASVSNSNEFVFFNTNGNMITYL